jgi:hypothetical protein
MMPIVTAGTLASLRAVYMWVRFRGVLIPDTGEYTRGGFGFYPSPLGRVLGMGGVTVLAAINMVACFAFASGSLLIARREGRNLWIVGAIVLLAPAAWWSPYASVDCTAAALLLFAYLCRESGRVVEAVALAVMACLIHLLIVPILFVWLLYELGRREPAAAILLFCVSISLGLALLSTPYGGILTSDPSNSSLGVPAFLGLIMFGGPFVLIYAVVSAHNSPKLSISRGSGNRPLMLPATVCIIGGALACAMQRHFNMRYGLPALGFVAPLLAPSVGWVSDHLRTSRQEGRESVAASP